MLKLILPTAVACAESFTDVTESALLPEERAALGAARHEGRRREFTTVRHCARRALADLGVPPVPLLPGERGAPRWPAGVVGSMTHCPGYRAAAVARSGEIRAVGIDAELHAALPRRVLGAVTRPEERERLAVLSGADPEVCWDRLLFCAKEAVYKAWFPMTRRRLGFADASVTFDRTSGSFHLDVSEPASAGSAPASYSFEGRWTATPGLLLATVAVPVVPVVPVLRSGPDSSIPPVS
ncbi:4'-phosphopantetheinyl transferase family protein [Streptomyces sp. 8N616]|uniref:4'-phosphopantetheinyl transferase family protein n=1 Tax=Streptomyces sp. 8N616 TaxID=3457414 RepID=UPI003FD50ACA